MTTFSITPLTRDQFEAARGGLAEQGVVVLGDEGTIEASRIGLYFAYNGTDTLIITIEHKPWIVPASVIEKRIREWFADQPRINGPAPLPPPHQPLRRSRPCCRRTRRQGIRSTAPINRRCRQAATVQDFSARFRAVDAGRAEEEAGLRCQAVATGTISSIPLKG